jgi:hypothetical protein
MAKVTIILEDLDRDGEEGMSLDVKFDPDFDGSEDPTLAQQWAGSIARLIASNAERVDYVDDAGDVMARRKKDKETH